MNKYTLSTIAQNDLEELLDFSIFRFGEVQSEQYFHGLIEVVKTLANNPKLGRNRSEIRPDLKSFAYKSHNIYYSISTSGIRIIRVLHQSRDIKELFKG